jgi:uncharacterized protein
MPLTFNIRHLEAKNLFLKGELDSEELELSSIDELVKAPLPLKYDIEVEEMENGILAQGELALTLKCECVRCLKPFDYQLEIPDWACHLALEGDEKVEVINDIVDLTPHIREDILLRFPQHPLCEPGCEGLTKALDALNSKRSAEQESANASAWSELNKLKLKE